MLEILFALLVAVALPVRAWYRGRRRAPPTPLVRYVAETLLLTVALAALLWHRAVPRSALGLETRTIAASAVDVVFCLFVVVGLDLWSLWRAMQRLRDVAADGQASTAALHATGGTYGDALSAGRALAAFIVVTIVGAVWEELCFRAVVFALLPRTMVGVPIGIAAGSFIFGAQHLRNGPSALVHSSFFGVMFSLLYLATNDLVAVIIAHATGNLLAAAQWAPRIERARQRALQQKRSPMFLG
jgi:membrane protease YdiL (CAAX protease family)